MLKHLIKSIEAYRKKLDEWKPTHPHLKSELRKIKTNLTGLLSQLESAYITKDFIESSFIESSKKYTTYCFLGCFFAFLMYKAFIWRVRQKDGQEFASSIKHTKYLKKLHKKDSENFISKRKAKNLSDFCFLVSHRFCFRLSYYFQIKNRLCLEEEMTRLLSIKES